MNKKTKISKSKTELKEEKSPKNLIRFSKNQIENVN